MGKGTEKGTKPPKVDKEPETEPQAENTPENSENEAEVTADKKAPKDHKFRKPTDVQPAPQQFALPGSKISENALKAFWDLSSPEVEKRSNCIQKLLEELNRDKNQLDYCLNRLIRGLKSSHDATRQGFAAALTSILRLYASIRLRQLLPLFEKHLVLDGNTNADKTNLKFGKTMCIAVCVRAGLLNSLSGDENLSNEFSGCLEYTKAAFQTLLQNAERRWYMSEMCFLIIDDLIGIIRTDILQKHFLNIFIPVLSQKVENINVDVLQLALRLEKVHNISWSTYNKSIKGNHIFSEKNFPLLGKVTAGSVSVHPRVHKVWSVLINDYLEPNPKKTSKKTEKNQEPAASNDLVASFWTHFIEQPLFCSNNPQKKYLGFNLFRRLLKVLDIQDCTKFFTKPFMRNIFASTANNKNPLKQITKHMLTELVETAIQTEEGPVIVLSQLIGANGHRQFDKFTKTNTVDRLVSHLSDYHAGKYFEDLVQQFLRSDAEQSREKQSHAKDDEKGKEKDNIEETPEELEKKAQRIIDSRRNWCASQIYTLSKALTSIGKAKDATLFERIANFFLFYTFFEYDNPEAEKEYKSKGKNAKPVKKAENPANLKHVLVPVSNPIADAVRNFCKERLLSFLKDSVFVTAPKTDATSEENKEKTFVAKNLRRTEEGELWIVHILKTYVSISNRSDVKTADGSQEAKTISKFVAFADKMMKKAASNNKQNGLAACLELVVPHLAMLILLYPDQTEDTIKSFNDIKELYVDLTDMQDGKQDKDEEVETNGEEEEKRNYAYTVLMDVLIYMLSHDWNLRDVVRRAFYFVAPQTPVESLEPVISVITKRNAEDSNDEETEGRGKKGKKGDDADNDEDEDDDDEEEEEDDDDDDDDDEEEEDDDEDDDDSDKVDQKNAKKRKINVDHKKSQKKKQKEEKNAKESDDSDDSDDELPPATDEEMFRLDKSIVEVFKQKKEELRQRKMDKNMVVQLRQRSTDLLDMYVKRQHDVKDLMILMKTLFLMLFELKSSEETPFRKRIGSLIEQLRVKKDVTGSLEVPEALSMMEELIDTFCRTDKKSVTGKLERDMVELIAPTLAFYVRLIWDKGELLAKKAESKKQTEKSGAKNERTVQAIVDQLARLVADYSKSRKSQLNEKVFKKLLRLVPSSVGWRLAQSIQSGFENSYNEYKRHILFELFQILQRKQVNGPSEVDLFSKCGIACAECLMWVYGNPTKYKKPLHMVASFKTARIVVERLNKAGNEEAIKELERLRRATVQYSTSRDTTGEKGGAEKGSNRLSMTVQSFLASFKPREGKEATGVKDTNKEGKKKSGSSPADGNQEKIGKNKNKRQRNEEANSGNKEKENEKQEKKEKKNKKQEPKQEEEKKDKKDKDGSKKKKEIKNNKRERNGERENEETDENSNVKKRTKQKTQK